MEIENEENYTSLNREYDPRLGRWWSIDPMTNKFPDHSPYSNNFNTPSYFKDPKGDHPILLVIAVVAMALDATVQASVIYTMHNSQDPSYTFGEAWLEVDYFDAAMTGLMAYGTAGMASSPTMEVSASKAIVRTITKMGVQGNL